MEHIEARAQKWKLLTGYQTKDKKKIPDIQEQYGIACRIGMELMLENLVEDLSKNQDLRLGESIFGMDPVKIQEAVTSTAIDPFIRVAMPLIRRLFVSIYAMSLMTVWPTQTPEAKIFFMDYTYGNNKYPAVAGNRIDLLENFDRNYAGWGHSYENFVGDGVATTFTVESAQIKTTASAGAWGSAAPEVFVDGVQKTLGTDFTVDNGGANSRGRIIFGVAPAGGAQIIVRTGTYAETDTPRDIDLVMSHDSLKVTDMALRAGWTEQMRQDLMAYHDLSVETELTAAIGGELDREIDWNLIKLILTHAIAYGAGNVNWSTTGYLPGDTDSTSRRSYEATLGDAVVQADNLIWKKTKGRARSSYCIMGPAAAQRFRLINSFRAFTGGAEDNGVDPSNRATVERRIPIGTVDGSKTVYMDPRFPDDKILLGYKSDNPIHMAAVYAPYNLLSWTPVMPDPSANFTYKKGVLSRAAKKVINKDCFATITLT
jgi:hypothetical protein